MKKIQQGFTLIELMIVVAIVGILAAIALPAYQDYTTRSKISEGLTLAEAAKIAVADHLQTLNRLPLTNTSAGYSSPDTKYVSGITIVGGVITVSYKPAAGVQGSNIDLTLSPRTTAGGALDWRCFAPASTGVDQKYLPANCRG
jgi:type IV pilus assembly protein PilA